MTYAAKMKLIALLESASDTNRERQFEFAYAAKVALERIRFAVRQIGNDSATKAELHEAAFQLMDALNFLQSADRRFRRWLNAEPEK
jgi:hypothetical protein